MPEQHRALLAKRQVAEALDARTREILDAPAESPDPKDVVREKLIVSECRYLMRLLSTRRRSAGEMRQRLTDREIPADIAHEVMARIARADLIDDEVFAREWIAQRRVRKGFSDRALREELVRREVSREDCDAAFAALTVEDGAPTPELAEEERCRELARERLRRSRPGDDRGAIARRLDAYLRRRGYEGSLAVRVIASEMRSAGI